ncbi:DNA alkylation repair protein [Methanocella sp. CWC-04]|uniref:DNA alkylation repair protein n=2 Tax=Methanooceanicella nereidis TaxID=2052831 RepID=A0AAP2RGN9_9EURY|nr:DNA alkylation repair protein [Methanocella sp. CWC-04]
MSADDLIDLLRSSSVPENKDGMKRFGINVDNALGTPMPVVRKIAKENGKDHGIALKLWDSGIHEARILASLTDDPMMVTEEQMNKWVSEFDSWDICDQVCSNLFDKTGRAYEKCMEWTDDEREFVKRAGFVMMAVLAVHDKKADDEKFKMFFPVIMKGAADERNFVKKAVNWALRQIGKRSAELNAGSVRVAKALKETKSKSARWIGSDALRELESERVRKKLGI